MKDKEIIELFFNRSEDAIHQTQLKYGKLCRKISMGILNDIRDVDECINDTWMVLWNHIPPRKPEPLKTYICRITKNLSLKCYKHHHAQKRNSEYELSLQELGECFKTSENVEQEIETQELTQIINRFVSQLPSSKRTMFLQRYWLLMPVKEISELHHISEKNASMKLSRIRTKLKEYLIQEGYDYV